jgi:cytochrome c5
MKKMLLITASVALMGVVATANAEDAGEKTYKMACFACHGTGAAGAPKLGDKAAWAPRIAQGADKLNEHAVKGFTGKSGVMPPKGGRTDLSDADVMAAVDYMVSNSK